MELIQESEVTETTEESTESISRRQLGRSACWLLRRQTAIDEGVGCCMNALNERWLIMGSNFTERKFNESLEQKTVNIIAGRRRQERKI
jgi:hypothetical protein